MGAFTLSYDERVRAALTIGSHNTLPLETCPLISSHGMATLFAVRTTLAAVLRKQGRP